MEMGTTLNIGGDQYLVIDACVLIDAEGGETPGVICAKSASTKGKLHTLSEDDALQLVHSTQRKADLELTVNVLEEKLWGLSLSDSWIVFPRAFFQALPKPLRVLYSRLLVRLLGEYDLSEGDAASAVVGKVVKGQGGTRKWADWTTQHHNPPAEYTSIIRSKRV